MTVPISIEKNIKSNNNQLNLKKKLSFNNLERE